LKSSQKQTLGTNRNLIQPEFRRMPASWRFVLNFENKKKKKRAGSGHGDQG
jgi:hypothetical protein